jgi:hypothetical protein
MDLSLLEEGLIVELAKDSALIESQLRQIISEIKEDKSLKRLLDIGRSLERHC